MHVRCALIVPRCLTSASGALWPEATGRQSHPRHFSLTLAAPRTEPVRDVLVRDAAAFIQLRDPDLNLVQLPAFGFDESGDRFGGQERLRAPSTPGQRLEALLGVGVDAYGQRCGHGALR